jgi:short-chain fatty acids transporter
VFVSSCFHFIITVSVGVAYPSAPAASAAKTAEAPGVTIVAPAPLVENRRVPGEWLEYSGLLTVLVCSLGFSYLGKVILAKGTIAALDLNT